VVNYFVRCFLLNLRTLLWGLRFFSFSAVAFFLFLTVELPNRDVGAVVRSDVPKTFIELKF
jgi:hypothetical protein